MHMRKTKVVIGQGATVIVRAVCPNPQKIATQRRAAVAKGLPYSDEGSGSEKYPCTQSALDVVFQVDVLIFCF